jgi:hypothetical protein
MTSEELASSALASWTLTALGKGYRAIGRQELPDMSLPTFLRAFANGNGESKGISLALVGFGVSQQKLVQIANREAPGVFTDLATDLNVAARWRNQRKKHPVVIAYARGRVAGVNTLRHLEQASSRSLTSTLLEWAKTQPEFTGTPAHTRLIEALHAHFDAEDLFSFEQVRAFLQVWSTDKTSNAPRRAISSLGLFADPNLFSDAGQIGQRLSINFEVMAQLRDRTPGQMEAIRKRLQRGNKAKLLKIFDKLQSLRRSPNPAALAEMGLDDALLVLRPKTDKSKEDKPDGGDETSEETRVFDPKKMQRACADALLSDREEELVKNADSLSKALHQALDADENGADEGWNCNVEVNGEACSAEGPVDRKFVSWIHQFCQSEVWGGLIESNIPDLKKALEDFDGPKTVYLRPNALMRVRGEEYSMSGLLAGWDEDLTALGRPAPGLQKLWSEFSELRDVLLGSLDELAHFPLEWFAGKASVKQVAEDYLSVSGRLFRAAGQNYGSMYQENPDWAKSTLEGLLSLDVVQVRVTQQDGKMSSKAVLLPTHPLHLWRYWRLSRILKGLGKEISEVDRAAVIKEAGEAVQFLSVIYASHLPDGRGAGQVLPVANDLHRLATFENLHNAYTGPDGQETLVYAVERFTAINRNHINPLRLVLINPPRPGSLLIDLIVKLLDGRKKNFLPRLRVEVLGTPRQSARLQQALLFDTREREVIEEKLASGRLELKVDRAPRPLEQLLTELAADPAHLVAVFDEAPVSIRRGGAGLRLPMSPFCVRRKVRFQQRWNELRLEVTSGDPPFYEFLELVKQAEGTEGEGTPYAWPEAEGLKRAVDDVLATDEFGAQWFFLADRVLPDEGEMVSQRLLRRREGQRQVLLGARDYVPLARLILPAFEDEAPNLLMPPNDLQVLLAEGAHLIGAGLIDLVKSDGKVVPARMIGLVGALLAARSYRRQYPNALLVSTDSQLARTWLRLGTQGERCDFFAVRVEGDHILAECVEVKTAKGKPRTAGDLEIEAARQQLVATLGAVREGLGDSAQAEAAGHYLAAPRNEMLKEVLVQGCMARNAPRELRAIWAGWLERLFGPQPETPELRGLIINVALGSAESTKTEYMPGTPSIRLEHITEVEIQALLSIGRAAESKPTDISEQAVDDKNLTYVEPAKATDHESEDLLPKKSSREDGGNLAVSGEEINVLLGVTEEKTPICWQPSVAGNPHLMIAGLPGMGKTTCLVSLCYQLATKGITPIVFSYHDDIDEQLVSLFPGIRLVDCSNLGFNPMRVPDGQVHGHLENAGQLRDIFAAIFPELGDLQREAIRGALKSTYESKGWGATSRKKGARSVPEFGAFLGQLRAITKPDAGTRALLARLGELDDYGFFTAASDDQSLLESKSSIVLQIHRTNNEAVQRAYASFAFYRIYQDMFARGRQNQLTHAIIFDEAHKASGLKLIPTMAKECRKFGLALVLASQESRDFDPSLFTAVANYLILRVTEDTARHLSKNIIASDRQRQVADRLKQLPKYDALWLCEGRKFPVQIRLNQLSSAVTTPAKSAKVKTPRG